MFCKRTRKDLPEDTFIAKPARIMAILQLCLVFTVMAWHAGFPFMGELFSLKSKLSVYQHVMGVLNPSYVKRFDALPTEKKDEILKNYQSLQAQYHRPFAMKVWQGLERLFFGFSSFKFLWVVFSLIIPILLLKKVEGAVAAIWLLPVVTFVFIIHNRWYGEPAGISKETLLFPTEEYLVANYLQHPLSANLREQEQQLKHSWDLYLIQEWAKESPSKDPAIFNEQQEKGDFAFNVKRLDYLKPETANDINSENYQASYYLLGLYLFWNLSFALVVGSALHGNLLSER